MTARLRAGPYEILRGNRPLGLLLVGQALSSVADWLLAVVLTVVVYDISHSGSSVALLSFARLAPYALVLPGSGYILDRMDRRLLMAGVGGGRAVCMLGLLMVHSQDTLLLAYPLVFISSSFSCLLRPTINATLPRFVRDQDSVAANSLVSQVDGVAHIAGPAIAAAFVLLHVPRAALLLTAAAFLISGLAFFYIRTPVGDILPGRLPDLSPGEVLAGFHFLLRENQGVLVALGMAAAGLALLAGAYYVLAVELCARTFGLGNQGVGWLDAVYGIGGLGGSLLVAQVVRGRRIAHVFVAGAAIHSLGVVLLAGSSGSLAPFACMAVIGSAGVVVQVTGTTILQSATPRDMLGRAFTAFEAALVVATLAGTLSAVPLLRVVGPRGATLAFGLTGLVLTLLALPRLRGLEEVLGLRVFLRGVPLLAGLSRPLLDELAPRFEAVQFQRGATIIQEGEPGDRLYIIRSGEVEVTVAGRPVRKLGVAGYFGEVALLRCVPRTASVRASATTEMYSLDRTAFQSLRQQAEEFGSRLERGVEGYEAYPSLAAVPRH